MGEKRSVYAALRRNLKERDHLGYPGVDARIIVRWPSGSEFVCVCVY
jgi:hypothetical protein